MEKLIFEIAHKYGTTGMVVLIVVLIVWYTGNLLLGSVKKSAKNISDTIVSNLSTTMNAQFEQITNAQSEQNTKMIEIISDQNKMLLEKLIEDRKDYREKQASNIKESQLRRINVSPKILQIITDLTNKLRCSRTVVLEFCNGSHNVAGLSFMNYAIGYEWHQKGVMDVERNVKVSLNTLTPFIDKIHESPEQHAVFTDTELKQINENGGGFLNKFKPTNITSAHLIGLYDDDNKISGILMFLYDRTYPFDSAFVDKKTIREEASRISTLLFSNVYKTN